MFGSISLYLQYSLDNVKIFIFDNYYYDNHFLKEMGNMSKNDINSEEKDTINSQGALFALQMYMNRFMWISTKEIITGVSSLYYTDTKNEKDKR